MNRERGKPAADVYKYHPFAKKPPPRQATAAEIAALFGPNAKKVQ